MNGVFWSGGRGDVLRRPLANISATLARVLQHSEFRRILTGLSIVGGVSLKSSLL